MVKYIPILKWKKGEQGALQNLKPEVKDNIIPLFEIPVIPTGFQPDALTACWGGRDFYYYLDQGWYEDIDEPVIQNSYDVFVQFSRGMDASHAVPVFDLSNTFGINKWLNEHDGRMMVRISDKDMSSVEEEGDSLLDKLERGNVDILIDLGAVDEESVNAKIMAMKSVLIDLDDVKSYHNIIISCTSFPTSGFKVEVNSITTFHKWEDDVRVAARRLAERMGFKYVYSDYGPTDKSDVPFVLGMVPNFKIKYTAKDCYCYIKGLSLKKAGLDIENVRGACKVLVSSKYYCGGDYSWGDEQIFQIVVGVKNTSGNLTNWVSYNFNHHITLLVNELLAEG